MTEQAIIEQIADSLPDRLKIRDQIKRAEDLLRMMPDTYIGDHFPLKHEFADGIYVRTIEIPADQLIIGKIHKHDHPNVLLKGSVAVITEHTGTQILHAPQSLISKAMTKRMLYTFTNTTWITFHNVGEERDLAKIEDMLIAKSYEELEETV